MARKTAKQKLIKCISNVVYPCVRLYWFIFRPNAYGVKCVIQNEGKILMIRNTYGQGLWTFPGGGVGRKETVEQAIKREVMEEVGVEVKGLRKIGEFTSTAEYKRDAVTVFTARSVNDQFKTDEKEILEAKWFFPENLPTISDYAQKILAMWSSKEM